MTRHVHTVQIYYEDTDFSGVVYHPNYLKYFERAREHMLGAAELVRLWNEEGVGFVVYRVGELTFHEGATYGDLVEIHTEAELRSEYRVAFTHEARRAGDARILVRGTVEMVCVNRDRKPVRLPDVVTRAFVGG
jgi:acyl-CoA thioester hydrolase